MGEAKIFLIPCETNILHTVIRIEITDSGKSYALRILLGNVSAIYRFSRNEFRDELGVKSGFIPLIFCGSLFVIKQEFIYLSYISEFLGFKLHVSKLEKRAIIMDNAGLFLHLRNAVKP